jgi:uncharacterized membrane protein
MIFSPILLAIISMLAYGFGLAIARVPIQKEGPVKTIFYRNLIISIIVLIFLLFTKFSFSWKYFWIGAFISLMEYIALVAFYKAVETGKIGVVTPIADSSIIITVALSLIFFSEKLLAAQILAIILIIAGIVLISYKSGWSKSGIPYALVTLALWGVMSFLIKIPVAALGAIFMSFILEFGIFVFSAIHLAGKKQSLKTKSLPYMIVVGICGAVGTLGWTLGIQNGPVSIITPIVSSSLLITVLYGRIVYKEKLSTLQYVCIALILGGIIMLSF